MKLSKNLNTNLDCYVLPIAKMEYKLVTPHPSFTTFDYFHSGQSSGL